MGSTLANSKGILWEEYAATALKDEGDKVPRTAAGKLVKAYIDPKSPNTIFLKLDFVYKDGTASCEIPDPMRRDRVLKLLNEKGLGKIMSEVLAWPEPQ